MEHICKNEMSKRFVEFYEQINYELSNELGMVDARIYNLIVSVSLAEMIQVKGNTVHFPIFGEDGEC